MTHKFYDSQPMSHRKQKRQEVKLKKGTNKEHEKLVKYKLNKNQATLLAPLLGCKDLFSRKVTKFSNIFRCFSFKLDRNL
jgi:hypothetical protein